MGSNNLVIFVDEVRGKGGCDENAEDEGGGRR